MRLAGEEIECEKHFVKNYNMTYRRTSVEFLHFDAKLKIVNYYRVSHTIPRSETLEVDESRAATELLLSSV